MGKLIQPKRNFTVVSNNILRDKEISLQAKGLYTIMCALPDNWDFSSIGLSQLSSNKINSTKTCLIELEKNGYLVRTRIKDDKGQFDMDYELFTSPKKKSTATVFPLAGFPLAEKPSDNKELNKQELKDKDNTAPDEQVQDMATIGKPLVNQKTTKKEKKEVHYKSSHEDITAVIYAMTSVDAKNKLYYGNSTQKGACDFLVQEYGLEAVLGLIEGIPKARVSIPYFPSITTPCELRDKWVKVFEAVHRMNKSKKPDVEMV